MDRRGNRQCVWCAQERLLEAQKEQNHLTDYDDRIAAHGFFSSSCDRCAVPGCDFKVAGRIPHGAANPLQLIEKKQKKICERM
jgi:hypothetical protein